jgi:CHU_C Type IX secretion signal domain
MQLSIRNKRSHLLILLSCFCWSNRTTAQCPALSQMSVLTSTGCQPSVSPCTLCPGEQLTLTTTGTGLQPGTCINWYYGNSNNFNPYNGQGTLMGCSEVTATAPNPCGSCPSVLALFVDACGTEQNNEILSMWSGSGFLVNDLLLNFNDANDDGPDDADVGSGCNWQEPNANAVASIQSICPGGTVVGAGPGEAVPPNVPVIVFTSAGYNFNYNFGSLCPLSPVIYVLQNGCVRDVEAFPNGPAGSTGTTIVSLACGCADNVTYNTSQLTGGNGAFFSDILLPIYGNAGCAFPAIPGGGGGGGSSPISVPSFTYTITEDMCNEGPYWVIGIVEPLNAGCAPVRTNAMPFNVVCPTPELGELPAVCTNAPNVFLNDYGDPNLPGTWSGAGVVGNQFDPSGLSGTIELTYTPNSDCGLPANATVQVFDPPTASFQPVSAVCAGQSTNLVLNLSGVPPFDFDLLTNGNYLDSYTTNSSPFTIPITPNSPITTYALSNFQDSNCEGNNPSVIVTSAVAGLASLSLASIGNLCAGQLSNFLLDFSGGTAPFQFTPMLNNQPQAAVSSNTEPVSFSLPVSGIATVGLSNISANGCTIAPPNALIVNSQTAPTATLQTSVITICAGQRDTLEVVVSGTGSLLLTYAVNGQSQPPVPVVAPSTVRIPLIPSSTGLQAYSLVSLSGGNCTGVVSGVDTTFIQALPSAVLSGSAELCQSGMVPLTVNYSPSGSPATLFYVADGVPQPPVMAIGSPFSWMVNVADNTQFSLTGITVNGCAGSVSGVANVNLSGAPNGVLTGGGDICLNGAGDSLTINFSGAGPYTFVYSINNVNQAPITTTQSVYKIFVNPVVYTPYRLVSVTNGTCTGTVSGLAEYFVYSTSAANLGADLTFCGPVSTVMAVNVTGTAPFILTYSINGTVQPMDTFTEGPVIIPANISQTTQYKLISIESPGCFKNLNDSASIFIHYPPEFQNLMLNCNAANGTYTVQFTAQGAPPFTLLSGNGSFAGNIFTSQPISQAQGYNFLFRDANNCGNVTVSGASTCNCVSMAGTMSQMPLNLCAGETASATFNNNATQDGSDVVRFILHDQPSVPVGQILAWSSTPVFNFNPTYSTGITYYISAIVGNAGANNEVDLNDPCRSVAIGTPVMWEAVPTATVNLTDSGCAGELVQIPVNLTGQFPLTLIFSENGQADTVSVTQSPFVISANLTQNTTWQLISVSSANCSGTVTGTANWTLNPAPVISNLTSPCSADNQTYTVEFTATNGDLATMSVGGTLTGTYNALTGRFVSNPIAQGSNFLGILSDGFGCGADTISGAVGCACQTMPGTLPVDTIFACSGGVAIGTDVSNGFFDNDDGLMYLLTDEPNPLSWQILAQSPIPLFDPPPSINDGQVYYIVAAIGNTLPGLAVDLSDACTQYSNAQPVIWQPIGTAQLSIAEAAICAGDTAQLVLQLTGNAPFTVQWTVGGIAQDVQNFDTGGTIILDITPSFSSNYRLVSATSNGCSATVGNTDSITVFPLPVLAAVNATCAPDLQSYILSFTVNNSGTAPSITGLTGSFSGNQFTSIPIVADQAYQITVTSGNGCSTTATGSEDCDGCVTEAAGLNAPTNACTNGTVSAGITVSPIIGTGQQAFYLLCTDPALLPQGILSVQSTPVFAFETNMTVETPYFIVAVTATVLPNGQPDFEDLCLEQSEAVEVRFYAPPVGVIAAADTTVCQGSNLNLMLNFTGYAPFEFTYALNGNVQPPIVAPLPNFTFTAANIQSEQTLVLVSLSDEHCSAVINDTLRIRLTEGPKLALSGGQVLCAGDSVSLTLNLENAQSASVEILQNGTNPLIFNNVTDGFAFLVSPDATTNYNFSNVTVTGNTCPVDQALGTVVTFNNLVTNIVASDFNGYGVRCFGDSNGSLTGNITGGTPPYAIVWAHGPTTLPLLELLPGTYAYTVTDAANCEVTDTLVLTEPDSLDFLTTSISPRCSGDLTGVIQLDTVYGGAGPYAWRLNQEPAQTLDALPIRVEALPEGFYDVIIEDANGCFDATILEIAPPAPLVLDLGPDRVVVFGDSTLLDPLIDPARITSIRWSPTRFLSDSLALIPWSRPFSGITYTLSVTDTLGCSDVDTITLRLLKQTRAYTPNAIAPDSDDNRIFSVWAGPEVLTINYLQIYDRWGEQLFDRGRHAPNDPTMGWDGRFRNEIVSPGVYVFTYEIVLLDGRIEQVSGDVTVVR